MESAGSNSSQVIRCSIQDNQLVINWRDGTQSRYHALWLRDNAPDARDTRNGQRLLESIDIPANIQAASAKLTDDGQIEIGWAEAHEHSRFSPEWLRAHAYSNHQQAEANCWRVLWDGTLYSLPRAHFSEIAQGGAALRDWLDTVQTYGFALLHGVPTESQALLKVVDLFGYVRETNYGRYFDVKSVVNPNNLAYTGLALSPHTDNPYREPVPTLQLLHCLAAVDNGGHSTVVDGFYVAETLRKQAPEQFALLATLPVQFHFQDQTTDLLAEAPLIRLDARGSLAAIRYNNRSIAPFNFAPEQMDAYYAAYLAFGRLINDPANQIAFKLAPGDLFMVDNERVLHGRTGFSSSGNRHLQGCYADRDGLSSTLRVLRRES
ncbi:MAG: TauD/TfdA family dioxygenase [Chloroflexi bacterium]|nr:TauD/TfdA family dioxygenase [Chloroflexota bacterium]